MNRDIEAVNPKIVTMTNWVPSITNRPGHAYQALADAITEGIAAGHLPAGSKLPPQRDLAFKLGVTVGTVGRAYALVQARGLLSGEIGRGSFVKPAADGQLTQFGGDIAPRMIDLRRNIAADARQREAFARWMQALAREAQTSRMLDYPPSGGAPAHRAAGVRLMAGTGFTPSPEQVIVTLGAQQALAVALQTVARPGDAVAIEALAYVGLKDLLRYLNLRAVPVALDEEGMCPEALAKILAEQKPAAIVLVPTFQNPTVSLMGQERRRAIADLARDANVPIIEDNVYGLLIGNDAAPIAALDPQNVFHIQSVSKIGFQGLRVGYLAMPARFLNRAQDILHAATLETPSLTAEIAARLISSGGADEIIASLTGEMAERHAMAEQALAGYSYRTHPKALHLWLELPEPWRARQFQETLEEKGVSLSIGETYAVGRAEAPHAIRLALSAPPRKEILAAGLAHIRAALADGPCCAGNVV